VHSEFQWSGVRWDEIENELATEPRAATEPGCITVTTKTTSGRSLHVRGDQIADQRFVEEEALMLLNHTSDSGEEEVVIGCRDGYGS
jgi:hypothetical protein